MSQLRLLLILLEDPHDVFGYQKLVSRMDLTGMEALHQVICKLRTKLSDKYIVTVPGIGYSLTKGNN